MVNQAVRQPGYPKAFHLLPASVLLTCTMAAYAQTAPLPSFEAASIRPVPTKEQGLFSISPYGLPRFTARNMSLNILISLAYRLDSDNLVGGPENLDSAVFDIEAVPAHEELLTYEKLQPLLQQLLQQRFHLLAHREMQQRSGYILTLAKGGSKLKSTETPTGQGNILRGELYAQSTTLDAIAGLLARPLHKAVAEHTGLTGNYTFDLKFAPEGDLDSLLPSIFTAVEEQLGLQLKAGKVPVETLVIDRVALMPTAN